MGAMVVIKDVAFPPDKILSIRLYGPNRTGGTRSGEDYIEVTMDAKTPFPHEGHAHMILCDGPEDAEQAFDQAIADWRSANEPVEGAPEG